MESYNQPFTPPLPPPSPPHMQQQQQQYHQQQHQQPPLPPSPGPGPGPGILITLPPGLQPVMVPNSPFPLLFHTASGQIVGRIEPSPYGGVPLLRFNNGQVMLAGTVLPGQPLPPPQPPTSAAPLPVTTDNGNGTTGTQMAAMVEPLPAPPPAPASAAPPPPLRPSSPPPPPPKAPIFVAPTLASFSASEEGAVLPPEEGNGTGPHDNRDACEPVGVSVSIELAQHTPGCHYRLYGRALPLTSSASRVSGSSAALLKLDQLKGSGRATAVGRGTVREGGTEAVVGDVWGAAAGLLLLHDFGVTGEAASGRAPPPGAPPHCDATDGTITLQGGIRGMLQHGTRYDAVLMVLPPPPPTLPYVGAQSQAGAAAEEGGGGAPAPPLTATPPPAVAVGLLAPLLITSPCAPARPAVPQQARGGKTALRVRWAAPADDGGADILDWELQACPAPLPVPEAAEGGLDAQGNSGALQWAPLYRGPERVAEHKGLAPGCAYAFRVRAFNAAGLGSEPSGAAVLRTDATVPSAPGVVRVGTAGPTLLDLVWDGPAKDHGAAVTEYHLESAVGASPPAGSPTAAPPGLQFETLYRGPDACFSLSEAGASPAQRGPQERWLAPRRPLCFRVSARNAVGWSLPSAVACVVVPASAPSTPPGLRLQPEHYALPPQPFAVATPASPGGEPPSRDARKSGGGGGRAAFSGAGAAPPPSAPLPVVPFEGVSLFWDAAEVPGATAAPGLPSSAGGAGGWRQTGVSATAAAATAAGGKQQQQQSKQSGAAGEPVAALTAVQYTVEIAAAVVADTAPGGIAGQPTAAPLSPLAAQQQQYAAALVLDAGPGHSIRLKQRLLAPGTLFGARVSARNSEGQSAWSAWLLFRTGASVPGAVTVGSATCTLGPGAAPAILAAADAIAASSSALSSAALHEATRHVLQLPATAAPRPQYGMRHGLLLRVSSPPHHGAAIQGFRVALRHVGPPLETRYVDAGAPVPWVRERAPPSHPPLGADGAALGGVAGPRGSSGDAVAQQLPVVLVHPSCGSATALRQALDGSSPDDGRGECDDEGGSAPPPASSEADDGDAASSGWRGAAGFMAGDAVEALYPGDGLWYAATVVPQEGSSSSSGGVCVELSCFGLRLNLPSHCVRPRLRCGDTVLYSLSAPPPESLADMAAGGCLSVAALTAVLPPWVRLGRVGGLTEEGYLLLPLLDKQPGPGVAPSSAKPAQWAKGVLAAAAVAASPPELSSGPTNAVPAAFVRLVSSAATLEQPPQPPAAAPAQGQAALATAPSVAGVASQPQAAAAASDPSSAPRAAGLALLSGKPAVPAPAAHQPPPPASFLLTVEAPPAGPPPPASFLALLSTHDGEWHTLGTVPQAVTLGPPAPGTPLIPSNGAPAPASEACALTLAVADALLPGHCYEVRVAAENALGLGPWGDPCRVTAAPGPPASAPSLRLPTASGDAAPTAQASGEVCAAAKSGGAVSLELSLPPHADWGGWSDATAISSAAAAVAAAALGEAPSGAASASPTSAGTSKPRAGLSPAAALRWVVEVADCEAEAPGGTHSGPRGEHAGQPVRFRRVHSGPLGSVASSPARRLLQLLQAPREGVAHQFSFPQHSLLPGREYAVRAAVWVCPETGLGPWSEVLLLHTPAGAPLPPPVAPVVTWCAPLPLLLLQGGAGEAGGGAAGPGEAPASSKARRPAASASDVGGVTVAAGEGPTSALLRGVITASVPDEQAPKILRALVAASTCCYRGSSRQQPRPDAAALTALVSWGAPAEDTGLPVTGYEVELGVQAASSAHHPLVGAPAGVQGALTLLRSHLPPSPGAAPGAPLTLCELPSSRLLHSVPPAAHRQGRRSAAASDCVSGDGVSDDAADAAASRVGHRAVLAYTGPCPTLWLAALHPGVTYTTRVRSVAAAAGGDGQVAVSAWGPPALLRAPADVPAQVPAPLLLAAGQTTLRVGFGRLALQPGAAAGGVQGWASSGARAGVYFDESVTGFDVQRVRLDGIGELMRTAAAAAVVAVAAGDSSAPSGKGAPGAPADGGSGVRSTSIAADELPIPAAVAAAASPGPPASPAYPPSVLEALAALLAAQPPLAALALQRGSLATQYIGPEACLPPPVLEEAAREAATVAAGRRAVEAPSTCGVRFGKLAPSAVYAVRTAATSAAGLGEFGPWGVFATLPPQPSAAFSDHHHPGVERSHAEAVLGAGSSSSASSGVHRDGLRARHSGAEAVAGGDSPTGKASLASAVALLSSDGLLAASSRAVGGTGAAESAPAVEVPRTKAEVRKRIAELRTGQKQQKGKKLARMGVPWWGWVIAAVVALALAIRFVLLAMLSAGGVKELRA